MSTQADGAAHWRQMGNVAAALFGPGILQSHEWKRIPWDKWDTLISAAPDDVLNPQQIVSGAPSTQTRQQIEAAQAQHAELFPRGGLLGQLTGGDYKQNVGTLLDVLGWEDKYKHAKPLLTSQPLF